MPKFELVIHILAQILAQGAVAALVPAGGEKYFAALVAIVGVVVALYGPYSTPTPSA